MKVLLVDDDADLLDVTAYALHREGFTVLLAGDGPQALRRWQADGPDVVVLDVRLPRMGGFEVCRQIRQSSSTPVILLTALIEEDHILQGFRLGADDYVTKPFSTRQLVMRIQAVWRRGSTTGHQEPLRRVSVGDMVVDAESHEVFRGDVPVSLTATEFRILHLLASNLGRVVSSSRLVDYAWGHDGGHQSLLKTHVSHIRTKLGLPARGPGGIEVLPMVGYRLTAVDESLRRPQLTSDDAGGLGATSCGNLRVPLRADSRLDVSTTPVREGWEPRDPVDAN